MTDPRRLNVALTRAQKAQFPVGDLAAIDGAYKALDLSAEANTEEDSVEGAPEPRDYVTKLQELGKILKRANAVKTYDISKIEPTGTTHTRAVVWKQARDNVVCYKCQEKGHTADVCKNPAK